MSCGNCQYLADFSDLGLGLRCMNVRNSPTVGDFMVVTDSGFSCSYFTEFSMNKMFEWDERKNRSNQEKHNIGFERIHDLVKDPNMLQVAEKPQKWEDLSNLPDHVERNEGNTDPVRGKWIGLIDDKPYTAVYTFRGGIGEMCSRIISLHRAENKDIKAYESVKESKQ
ncbi:Putative orphan protein [Moritella viscosa]|uniref:BrnT family toxin n=1 Tax=Moritella viscosa TaxID=80854 RepID=UPI0005092289|nr:BrnT family toxin [Moritella viscosa]CED59170.1 putative uncharacterized protein [Moritella viscosa]SHO00151.1 Putative orphan protein [Moritella viscosa]SHO20238.1 Putative orphan protein [Moritella viscosa]